MRRTISLILTCAVVAAGESTTTAGSGLQRLDPVFTVNEPAGIRQPALVMGNKRVGVREARRHGRIDDHDQVVAVTVDGRTVCETVFWGGDASPYKDLPESKAQLEIDESGHRIVYTLPHVRKDGGRSTFTYVLKALDAGRVELTWDSGSEQKVSPWLLFGDGFREDGIAVDGRPVAFPDLAGLPAKEWEETSIARETGSAIVRAPGADRRSFSVLMEQKSGFDLRESRVPGGRSLRAALPAAARGRLVFDLGLCASAGADPGGKR